MQPVVSRMSHPYYLGKLTRIRHRSSMPFTADRSRWGLVTGDFSTLHNYLLKIATYHVHMQ